MKVRTAAKAIIIQDGKLLCTKNQDKRGFYYMLPGGGQEHGENMIEALQRECLEEISAKVNVGEVLFIRDFIARNHELGKIDPDFHQLELLFECRLEKNAKIGNGINPDARQVGVEWIELEDLKKHRFYPDGLKNVLANGQVVSAPPIYLGDIN